LRDETWKQKATSIYQKAQATGHIVATAAEYAGDENFFLEFKRKQLYSDFPPSEEFGQWMKTLNNKEIAKPPI
jgi:predicted metallo-beta-lactamase superfamily hydrolase